MESYLLKGVSKKTETNGKTNGLKIEKGKGEKKVLWQQKKVQNEANWPTKQQHQQQQQQLLRWFFIRHQFDNKRKEE